MMLSILWANYIPPSLFYTVFGRDVGLSDHHVDFDKKIVEEEQMNLDEILKGGRCKNLDVEFIDRQNKKGWLSLS